MPASDWISAAAASALTGVVLTAPELDVAANEVYDEVRWVPDPTLDFLDTNHMTQVRQKRVLGESIAWQAAHRSQNSPLRTLDRRVKTKSVGRFSKTYADDGQAPVVAVRVRRALASAGLLRQTGYSHSDVIQEPEDEDRIIPTT